MSSDIEKTSLLGSLSSAVGVPEPALTLLLSVTAGFPLAIIHRQFFYGKPANVQHIYHMLTGFALGYLNYGMATFHSVFTVFFTYLTFVIFRGSGICLAVSFIFNMAYLLIGYHYSSTNDYDINWTLPQCVLVLRLIGITFDFYDGQQPVDKLTAYGKRVALHTRPTLLEFCGHMFFPASFLIGPQFPMRRYLDFVAGKYSDAVTAAEGTTSSESSLDGAGVMIPPASSVGPAIKRGLLGVMYLAIFQIVGIYVTDDLMISDEFYAQPFWRRCLVLGIWGRISLYKYISCWLLTEGACILFGLTYNGNEPDGTRKWDGCANVLIGRLETATEFSHYIQSFNTNTNHWVAEYIYKRLKFLGNRYVSQACALGFLAIWHGFHSGYFVCFLFEFLVMYLEKDLQSIINTNEPLKVWLAAPPVSTAIYIFLRIYAFVFMGWCMIPFSLFTFEKYWRAYGNVYYMGFWLYMLWPLVYTHIVRALIGRKKVRTE